ncbi:MAG: hypothetical protein ABI851_12490 [Saprospiraceae bacterium]
MRVLLSILLLSFCQFVLAQSESTAEDSLHKGLSSFISNTSIGGYGNVLYKRNFNQDYSSINLERFVLFLGHKFSKKIYFFSELEVEDALVSGAEEGGEIALEQCYLKFNTNPNNYFVAGLFLPRIGILNENHLPNTFNGNERTQVETLILPSTWRELGIAYYGNLNRIPLTYSIALMNGLDAASFEHGSALREGRFEGRNASANNLALSASLKYNKNNLIAQISSYYGGSVGLAAKQADSLQLDSGFFGTPVLVNEANLQYESNGFSLRLLGSYISIPNALEINRAYASNTPQSAYGVYLEAAYNIFKVLHSGYNQELNFFARYEKLDLNYSIPENGIIDETLNQQHIVIGLNYLPIKNVSIKADIRLQHTGKQNPALIINPSPTLPVYKLDNTFLNLGIGYSF